MDCKPARLLCPRDSPGKNTEVGCRALLWGTFPIQGSNQPFLMSPALVGRFLTTCQLGRASRGSEKKANLSPFTDKNTDSGKGKRLKTEQPLGRETGIQLSVPCLSQATLGPFPGGTMELVCRRYHWRPLLFFRHCPNPALGHH